MKNKKHLIFGVLLLLSAMFSAYEMFHEVVRFEERPTSSNVDENQEFVVHYMNPLTFLFVGQIELAEGFTLQPDFIGRFWGFIQILLICLLLKHSIDQLRGRPLTALTRMLVLMPFIRLLVSFAVMVQRYFLEAPLDYLNSNEWRVSALFGILGIVILLIYGKPEREERKEEGYMSKAPIGLRFIHQIFDRSIVIFFLYLYFINFIVYSYTLPSRLNEVDAERIEATSDIVFLLLSVLVAITIGLFEGISHWSPAKLITGYQVRRQDKEPIHFGSGIVRALCRLIPFDAWSFLFNSNWHDRISGTTLHYQSSTPWLVKQIEWMRRLANVIVWVSLFCFFAMVLDVCAEERILSLGSQIDTGDFFNFYWQLPLLLIALFIPLQAGFSAALMYHADCIWDKEANDKGAFLFMSLFSWVPFFGWFVCAQSTSNVQDAYERTHGDHPEFARFSRCARSTRRTMRIYHALMSLAIIALLIEGWNLGMLLSVALFFLLAVTIYCFSWSSYIDSLHRLEGG